jgi:hypothetical protein
MFVPIDYLSKPAVIVLVIVMVLSLIWWFPELVNWWSNRK